jgi:K+-transporting ATPase ATPase C chain
MLMCCVAYPLTLLGIGQAAFPEQANGSLLTNANGQVIGSRLIAQAFAHDGYFWPRPSAVDYNAAASGGSNWGASNPKLRERAEKQLALFRVTPLPADLVTASGSGLDPHITLRAARVQLSRVAAARSAPSTEIDAVLTARAVTPQGSEPLINVLELNAELNQRWPRSIPIRGPE